jgi:hypothetical protein
MFANLGFTSKKSDSYFSQNSILFTVFFQCKLKFASKPRTLKIQIIFSWKFKFFTSKNHISFNVQIYSSQKNPHFSQTSNPCTSLFHYTLKFHSNSGKLKISLHGLNAISDQKTVSARGTTKIDPVLFFTSKVQGFSDWTPFFSGSGDTGDNEGRKKQWRDSAKQMIWPFFAEIKRVGSIFRSWGKRSTVFLVDFCWAFWGLEDFGLFSWM